MGVRPEVLNDIATKQPAERQVPLAWDASRVPFNVSIRRLKSLSTPNHSGRPQHSEHQQNSTYDLVEQMNPVTPQQARSGNQKPVDNETGTRCGAHEQERAHNRHQDTPENFHRVTLLATSAQRCGSGAAIPCRCRLLC